MNFLGGGGKGGKGGVQMGIERKEFFCFLLWDEKRKKGEKGEGKKDRLTLPHFITLMPIFFSFSSFHFIFILDRLDLYNKHLA